MNCFEACVLNRFLIQKPLHKNYTYKFHHHNSPHILWFLHHNNHNLFLHPHHNQDILFVHHHHILQFAGVADYFINQRNPLFQLIYLAIILGAYGASESAIAVSRARVDDGWLLSLCQHIRFTSHLSPHPLLLPKRLLWPRSTLSCLSRSSRLTTATLVWL